MSLVGSFGLDTGRSIGKICSQSLPWNLVGSQTIAYRIARNAGWNAMLSVASEARSLVSKLLRNVLGLYVMD